MVNEYGVLLPHFSEHATRKRVIEDVQQLEAWGFDSVWVRDHLVYRPHRFESQDRTFVDPFVVLSGIAAVTDRIQLAFGSLILHRHPIHTALLIGSLDFLAGGGRVVPGFGLGTFDAEYAAIGMEGWDRRDVIREQIDVMRALWKGEEIDHDGAYYQFTGVDVHPVPSGEVPIWYCGSSLAAARRAVEYCDGWIPGRMPRRDLRRRVDRMRQLSDEAGTPLPKVGVIPYVNPGRTMEEAMKGIDIPAVVSEASKRYSEPPSGRWETLADLDGAVIAGTPDVIVEEVRAFQAEGVEHFVFDLRTRFDAWEDCIQILGEEILPELRRGDAPG